MGKAKSYFRFLSAALTKPSKMGAIAPSSEQLARLMVRDVKPSDFVVEIGPGTGAITRVIREKLQSPQQYLGVDINPGFIQAIRKEFPEMNFVADSAENLGTHFQDGRQVDSIACSLPWSIWRTKEQARILAGLMVPLRPNGTFATYAYWPMLYTPAGLKFRRALREAFRKVEVTPIVWGNLPPAVVYLCTK